MAMGSCSRRWITRRNGRAVSALQSLSATADLNGNRVVLLVSNQKAELPRRQFGAVDIGNVGSAHSR